MRKYNQLVYCCIVVFFFAVIIHISLSLIKIIATSAPDFTIFYGAALDILQVRNPYVDASFYTVFNYPPITAFLYTPFTILPLKSAQEIFVVLSALSVFGIVFFSLKIIQKKVSLWYFLFFSSLAFLSFPVKFTLGMGQTNLIAFLLLLVGFYSFKQELRTRAGIFIAFSILLKPVFLLVFVLFLFWKQWRIIFVTTGVLCFITSFTIPFKGLDLFYYYLSERLPHLSEVAGREVYYNQGLLGFISRLTSDISIRKYASFIFSLILTFFTFWRIQKNKTSKEIQLGIFLSLLVIIDTLSWQHHFVFLLFPMILFAVQKLKKRNYRSLFLVFLSYCLVSFNIKDPTQFASFPYVFVLSHALYGSFLLFVFLVIAGKKLKSKN